MNDPATAAALIVLACACTMFQGMLIGSLGVIHTRRTEIRKLAAVLLLTIPAGACIFFAVQILYTTP